ncbi:MAG: FAD:protein FMN transferase [Pirellulaceae bacterium]|nr:FAD:protein FMN transferase [Pirellulaceae bacterium]
MQLSRRKSIVLTLGSGVALFGAGAWRYLESGRQNAVTRTAAALGAEATITILGLPAGPANIALDAAFAELEAVESVLSLYRSSSQVCELNRAGVVSRPHPYLLEVLRVAEATSRRSAGAFDITVQPLWRLFAEAHRAGRLPPEPEIAAARDLVDWRAVEVSRDTVRLTGDGKAITLNGIAQGYAADRVRQVLREQGVRHALVNTGEIGACGANASRQPWTIGIQHPREPEAYVALAHLGDRSLATSGDYETSFSADFRHNHIFDPRTGRSPGELASVSIVAPTACQADALSTAAMVLGEAKTLALVATLPDVEAFLVRKDGATVATPGFPEVAAAG